jgi:hypothetical protein
VLFRNKASAADEITIDRVEGRRLKLHLYYNLSLVVTVSALEATSLIDLETFFCMTIISALTVRTL